MPQGLQVFKSDGSLRVDITDRLARIVGSQTVVLGTPGSVTVDLAYGNPWAVILPGGSMWNEPPSISGNTISWGTQSAGLLYYGVS